MNAPTSTSLPGPSDRRAIKEGLALIFQGIERLRVAYPHRKFTADGRLVGDIGEIIAELDYELTLHAVSQPGYDAVTPSGLRVQIKATFKDNLSFRATPDYYLGFKLYPDGNYDEVYNGPGLPIFNRYSQRVGMGTKLLSFPIKDLRLVSAQVPAAQRIPRRPPPAPAAAPSP